jgi:hypothetical protein
MWPLLWQAPIQTTALPTASECGACHPRQLAGWSRSGHHEAWIKPLFRAGFAAEPRPWCAWCHAPLPEMRAEVAANRDWYRWQDPRAARFGPEPVREDEPAAQDGVSCVACHQPDGGPVRTPSEARGAPHDARRDEALVDGTACRACHEFPMPAWDAGGMRFTDLPMQSTWSEWTAWRDGGGVGTCVSCHLPDGDHDVRGASDRDWLRRSVAVAVLREGDRVRLEVRSIGVGHRLPSGDLFRHLTVEVDDGGGWRVVGRIGREFALDGVTKVPVADTTLAPGVPFAVEVDAGRPVAWRLVWHDGADHDEERGWVDPASIVAVIASGSG